MAIIPSVFINATVSIGIRQTNGKINWTGTGFFLMRKTEEFGKVRPFLVTNKHVVKGVQSIVIRMKEKDKNTLREIDCPLFENGNPTYFLHDNDKIDIAVVNINGGFIDDNNLEFQAFDIDDNAMTSAELLSQGVDAGSFVYMLGFPMGLVNKEVNVPICRIGCIARICQEQIKESFNILLDIQNFPGNSGSPIVSRPEFVSVGDTGSLNKCVLLGIIHSYIPYQETLINSQTGQTVEIRSENSGIANMHPVEFILEIIDKIYPKPLIS